MFVALSFFQEEKIMKRIETICGLLELIVEIQREINNKPLIYQLKPECIKTKGTLETVIDVLREDLREYGIDIEEIDHTTKLPLTSKVVANLFLKSYLKSS